MISVIVPVYKVEPYLRQCIDSILAQKYTDFELILVDDGSPDNCGRICDEYAKQDDRIRVIHQENQGLSAARNAGIDIAKGEYLTFIDSDDFVSQAYLKCMWQIVTERNVDIAICKIKRFVDGQPIYDSAKSTGAEDIEVFSGRTACEGIYRLDGSISIVAWGKLYKAFLFAKLRFPVGMLHEDNAVTPIVCYEAAKVAVVSSELYYYRQRADSIMGEPFSTKRFEQITATELCIDHFKYKHDEAMVSAARRYGQIIQAKLVIMARSNHMESCIPEKYRISEWQALRIIRREVDDDLYCWYLSLVHPKWVKLHSYWAKIRKTIKSK